MILSFHSSFSPKILSGGAVGVFGLMRYGAMFAGLRPDQVRYYTANCTRTGQPEKERQPFGVLI